MNNKCVLSRQHSNFVKRLLGVHFGRQSSIAISITWTCNAPVLSPISVLPHHILLPRWWTAPLLCWQTAHKLLSKHSPLSNCCVCLCCVPAVSP